MSTLRGATALVTGATGFLGGALALRLAAAGVRVKALARRPNRDHYLSGVPHIEVVTGDILDAARMKEVTQGCDYVFHAAAALSGSLAEQRPANVTGTLNVLRAAEAAGARRLVHVSSVAIYGTLRPADRDIFEETPPLPCRIPYNQSKREGEEALIAAASMDYSIIRPAMIYGPRSALWTRGLFNLARRRPTPFIGDGSGSAYPIYVDDVVEMMLILAEHPRARREAFNCAPDPSPTWREFISAYSALAGHQQWLGLPPLLLKPLAYLAELGLRLRGEAYEIPQAIDYLITPHVYRMTKAQSLLGWQPAIPLAEGIARCAPYLRAKGLLAEAARL